jgi:hypothetical protein
VIGLCFPNLPFPNNKLFEGEGGCHKKKVIDMNYYPTKNYFINIKKTDPPMILFNKFYPHKKFYSIKVQEK